MEATRVSVRNPPEPLNLSLALQDSTFNTASRDQNAAAEEVPDLAVLGAGQLCRRAESGG